MNANQNVTGLYLGTIPFSGVIADVRPLLVKTDGCFEFVVNLLAPVIVHGTERTRLVLNTKIDGSSSSYTNHTCTMTVA